MRVLTAFGYWRATVASPTTPDAQANYPAAGSWYIV